MVLVTLAVVHKVPLLVSDLKGAMLVWCLRGTCGVPALYLRGSCFWFVSGNCVMLSGICICVVLVRYGRGTFPDSCGFSPRMPSISVETHRKQAADINTANKYRTVLCTFREPTS